MRRADALPLLTATPVLALLAWWAFAGGGYAPTVWYPGALLLLGLLAALVGSGAATLPRRLPLRLACGALAVYTLWSFASILWADSRGDAVEGSHRTLLYLLAFLVMALVRWTPTALLVAVGAWVAIVTAAAVKTLLALAGDDPVEQTIDARLSEPMGYMNADPALWTMAALPALVLGARRETPAVLRVLLLGSAALLVQLCLLSQSRGWLFSLPFVLLVCVLLIPLRLRSAIFALPIGAALAVSAERLLEPFDVAGGRNPPEVALILASTLGDAASAAWTGAAVALGVAVVLVLVDRLLPASGGVRRAARPAGALLAVAVLAVAAVAVHRVSDGDPVERVDRAWEDFKDFEGGAGEAGGNRFSRLGSSRYDFWRVSVDLWRANPVLGTGQDNYAEDYVLLRASPLEETRWAHSLPLRLLTHTGVVGLLLVLLALAAAVAAAGVLRRSDRARAGPAATIALLPLVPWVVHGSLDWLWEYPVLSGAALALAGAAAGLGTTLRDRDEPSLEDDGDWPAPAPPPRARVARLALAAPLVLIGAGAAAWLGATFVAERNEELGERAGVPNPRLALERFDRAAALDPFDAEPPLLEGLVAEALGQRQRARSALREAIERSPRDWFARFELGLLPGQPDARALLLSARDLNPREELVREALRRLGGPDPMTQAEAAGLLRQRVRTRLGA